MDGVRDFLNDLLQHQKVQGHFLGLLHVVIGRRITRSNGTVMSTGVTWRDLASLLKQVRWDPESVRELGMDPDKFSARDRQRFWYMVIAQADVASAKAIEAGNRLAIELQKHGYVISQAPGAQ